MNGRPQLWPDYCLFSTFKTDVSVSVSACNNLRLCNVSHAGDFDVPSSREDVDRDSMWNQWLRNEMHSLFVDALHHFKVRIYVINCLFFIASDDQYQGNTNINNSLSC